MKSSIHTTLLAATMAWLAEGISVPTGKDTPIAPAKPTTPPPARPGPPRAPAPVTEYTEDSPEPPPLHPSYVPPTYQYLDALAPAPVYYVPLRIKNIGGYESRSSPQPPPPPPPPTALFIPVRTLDYSFPVKPAYPEPSVVFHPSKTYHKKPYLKYILKKPYTDKLKYTSKSLYPKKAVQHHSNYLYYLNNQ